MLATDARPAGYYTVRLVRGGAGVPVELRYGAPLDPDTGEEMDRAPRMLLFVAGRYLVEHDPHDPHDEWYGRLCFAQPLTAARYRYLSQVQQWAEEHAPGLPEACPEHRIELNRMNSLF